MDRLRSADIDTLVDVVHDIGELSDLDGFRRELLGQIRRLVACDIAAYNEVGGTPGQVEAVVDPAASYRADMRDSFAAHVHENPMVIHHACDPAAPALRLSDFLSGRQLRRLELYDLIYGPLGTDYQVAIAAPASGRVVGITASRARHDFDDHELAMLNAVRPFLIAALRNFEARRRIEATMAALRHAHGEPAAILFSVPGAGIEAADERAERWLGSFAGERDVLVAELEEWARGAARVSDSLDSTGHPEWLSIAHPGGRHRALYVPGACARPAAILVQAPVRWPQAADLRRLGLTPRQADALHRVSLGQTNAEIGQQLGISERTVAHHLEHVYGRLGVGTRTAAVSRARELLGTLT